MAPVHVRVGHADDPVVAELLEREILVDAGPERSDHRLYLVVGEHPVQPRLLDVEDLPRRQDCLEPPVAALLGSPALSPSTMKISHNRGSFSEQSASSPGNADDSSTVLRRVSSRALRAPPARARSRKALLQHDVADRRIFLQEGREPSPIAESTSARISLLPSFVLVWPSNCGSNSRTFTIALRPSRMSSPARLLSVPLRMLYFRA